MSNEPMKIPVNYAEAAETLRKLLDLKGSPVAIRFDEQGRYSRWH